MHNIWLAVRALRRSPGLSLSVILLLGLGVGANTALFSVLRDTLLRPEPGVARPHELVRIQRTQNGRAQNNQSYPDYLDVKGQSRTLSGLAAERIIPLRLSGPPAQIVTGAIVSGNYFQVLGAKAAAGRLLSPDDDRVPDGHSVVVLSEGFWRRQFGGDMRTVGSTLVLNGHPFTVIGVASAPFEGVEFGEPAAMWLPMMMVREAMPRNAGSHLLTERRAGWLTWYGRLTPASRRETAEAELNTIAGQLEQRFPASNTGRRLLVREHAGMTPEERSSLRSLLGLLSAAALLVLLIACGNVANLLLARASSRGREMAIRVALGAARGTLMRDIAMESLVLGLAGCGLGLLLAPWIETLLRTVWGPQSLLRQGGGSLDWQLMVFALAVSLVAVLLCGVPPAWIASRRDAGEALKAASPRLGSGRGRAQNVWVVAQVALSVALAVAGSIMLRSMQRIASIDPGFRPDRVLVASMDLSLLGYSPERGTRFFAELRQTVAAAPGTRSATLGKSSPAVDWSDHVPLLRAGEPSNPGTSGLEADRNIIAPDYFRTLGIPLLRGRDFTEGDRTGSAPVAIVSQGLADRLWPGQNAIGRQLVVPVTGQALPPALEVVGVAADARYRSILDAPPLLLYVPLSQNYDSISKLMVAVEGDAAQYRDSLRRAIQAANPDLPVRVVTMREQLQAAVWRQRAVATLLSFFGVLALGLACAGIHGVVAYRTEQRTREIGIRMALGAARHRVVGQVVGQAMRLTAMGIGLGLPLAMWARPALAAFQYRSGTWEPAAMAGVPLLFLMVAALASFRPARRAAAIDPSSALRQE